MEIQELVSKAKYHIELARTSADSIGTLQMLDAEKNVLTRQIGYNLDVARKLLAQSGELQPQSQVPQLERMLLETQGKMQVPFQEVRKYMKPESEFGFYRWNTWAPERDEIKKGSYEQIVLSLQHRWGLI